MKLLMLPLGRRHQLKKMKNIQCQQKPSKLQCMCSPWTVVRSRESVAIPRFVALFSRQQYGLRDSLSYLPSCLSRTQRSASSVCQATKRGHVWRWKRARFTSLYRPAPSVRSCTSRSTSPIGALQAMKQNRAGKVVEHACGWPSRVIVDHLPAS